MTLVVKVVDGVVLTLLALTCPVWVPLLLAWVAWLALTRKIGS